MRECAGRQHDPTGLTKHGISLASYQRALHYLPEVLDLAAAAERCDRLASPPYAGRRVELIDMHLYRSCHRDRATITMWQGEIAITGGRTYNC
jgi:hypothetical protein